MPSFVSIGKSKQFYEFLKNALISGQYNVGDKFPSIRELSQKYEISKPTINTVISNLVNDGLLTVIQGKGTFVVRTDVKTNTKSHLIGVIMMNYSDASEIEYKILGHLGDVFQKKGYYIVPVNTNNNTDRFYSAISVLKSLQVEGMIVIPSFKENYDVSIVKSLMGNLPIVCINRDLPGCNRSLVQMDFCKCGYLAMKHLLKQGRKHIVVRNLFGSTLFAMMMDGCRTACKEFGQSKDDIVIENDSWEHIENITEIDGIISSDWDIYNNWSMLKKHGLNPSENLGIVGINDSNYSRLCTPKLTAIRNSDGSIAEECVKLLLARMDKDDVFKLSRIPCTLVERNT